MHKPTVGEMVHYTLSDQDVQKIDQGVDSIAIKSRRNPVRAGQVLAAFVVAEFGGGFANLKVQLDGYGEYWATSRKVGTLPGDWQPMP